MEQYFSGERASKLLVEHILQFAQKDITSVCEPCAGDGALVNAFKAQRSDVVIYAHDIDKSLCTKYGWIEADFLATEPIPCDVVICNPPFSSGRDDNANARRGRDIALAFLLQACKWAPLLGFIMHQNKGNPTFAHQIWTARPDISLVHKMHLDKADSIFRTSKGNKYVPCAIYIYKVGGGRRSAGAGFAQINGMFRSGTFGFERSSL